MGRLIVLILLLWASHVGDMLTTFVALDRGCIEANPIMAAFSRDGMLTLKTGCMLLVSWLVWHRWQTSPRTAHLLLWLGILAGAGAAVWNLHQLPLC